MIIILFLIAVECKEKWKNLRAVFVLHIKPAPSGSATKIKKPYYLAEAMQFTLPYIKILSSTTGNIPNVPEVDGNEQQDDIVTQEYDSQHSQLLSPPQPLSSSISNTSVTIQPQLQKHGNSIQKQSLPPLASRLTNKRALRNDAVDKTFVEYLEAKKAKIASAPNPKTEALKLFLLSMIPDLELMNDDQIRKFKRINFQTIDDILSENFQVTYSPVPSNNSLVCQTPTHSSHSSSSSTIHLEIQMSQLFPVITQIPILPMIESYTVEPGNNQPMAADKYYDTVKQAFGENFWTLHSKLT